MCKTTSAIVTIALLAMLGTARAQNGPSSVDCAFLAQVKIHVNNGGTVRGDVGANDEDGRVSIGKKTVADEGTTIIGDAVRLGNGSSVDKVEANSLRRGRNVNISGSISGAILPIQNPFCPVPDFDCGGPSIVVPRGDSNTIAPGSYSSIVVEGGGSLTLEAGDYEICELTTGRKANILIESGAQSTLNIVEDLLLDNGASLTVPLGTVPPQINVLGKRVRLSQGGTLHAFVSAPNATVRIGNGGTVVGSFCARRATTGRGISLLCSEVVPTTTSTVPQTTTSTTSTTSTSTSSTTAPPASSTSTSSTTPVSSTVTTSTSSTTSTSTSTSTTPPGLECPCWDDFTQESLVAELDSAAPAFPACEVSEFVVVLRDGSDPILTAANEDSKFCELNLGDIERRITLDSAMAALCLGEAKAIEPQVVWCAEGTTTSSSSSTVTTTSSSTSSSTAPPESTTSTSTPESTTTSSSSTSTSTSTSTSSSTTEPLLQCPCWDDFTQDGLAAALSSATPAFPVCTVGPNAVHLFDDEGGAGGPDLLAVNDAEQRRCALLLGDIDRNVPLDSATGALCLGEATALEPEVTWCQEGTTTSSSSSTVTTTSTSSSTAPPETSTTTFLSTSTSSVSSTSSTSSSTVSTSTTSSETTTTSSVSSTSSTSSSTVSTSTTSSETTTTTTSTSSSSSTTSTSVSTSSSSSTSSTSSSTSTTAVVTTTTTSTTAPPTKLDFTSTAGGGVCGETYNNTSATPPTLSSITCGGLKIGGGSSIVGENVTPDGFTNRMNLSCVGNDCTISGQATTTPDFECSNTGCRFGTPLPLAAAGISSCIYNTFTAPLTGTVNLATGVASLNIQLSSATRVTGNAQRPCPVCVNASNQPVNGSPSAPATGTCDRGPNVGAACTSRNSQGLTYDCQTDGSNAGAVAINLSPVTTSARSQSAQNRIFCPNLVPPQDGDDLGCFNNGLTCRRIEVRGTPAGPIPFNTPTFIKLASIFCVPQTTNATVNFSADLPGPGATSIVGNFTTKP